MSRRIVLWRHGRTAWNAEGIFQGQTDVALDDIGYEQAQVAAVRLAALAPTMIVSSDLQRARDTAAVLGGILGQDVQLEPRLRETYAADWQGLTAAEIALRWPAEYKLWRGGDPMLRVGGGESRQEVAARVFEVIHAVAAQLPDDGLAVLTTHGGAARLGIATAIGMPLHTFTKIGGLSNCSWSILRESDQGWILVEHNAGTLPSPVVIEEG